MAVKKYSLALQGDLSCSEHTTVREMASIGQGKTYSDTVLVDEALMEMVEKLFSRLNCKKYVISSGYRTKEHEIALGGKGNGYHTKGMAVDACFYGKNNKIIPAQIVCCVAQDLGFGGIANISRNYYYVHLDVRSGTKYKGDEIYNWNTVTKDFYDYFKLSKADVDKYTGEEIIPAATYKKYSGTSFKIDTVLKEIGVPTKYLGNFKNRKPIAEKNGIAKYIGSATQNLRLIALAKKGKLKKV